MKLTRCPTLRRSGPAPRPRAAPPGRHTISVVAYPPRPVLDVLPQFANEAKSRWVPEEIARLDAFVAEYYPAGYSIHQLGELPGRTQTAIRRSLDRTGNPRRGRGAPLLEITRGDQETEPGA